MKTILTILLLAALALLGDLVLAALGLSLVAAVLLVGDLAQLLPAPSCCGDCDQGRGCSCMPADGKPAP